MSVRVFGVIPAAGRSRRMGRDKQLIDVGGRPMLTVVIDAMLSGGVRDVHVVTRRLIFDALPLDARDRVTFVENDDPATEMIDSVRMAIDFLRKDIGANDGVAVCPGDLPAMTAADVRACVDAFAANPDRIVVAACGGKRGHPIIFPGSLVPAVLSDACDAGLKALMQSNADRVMEVDVGRRGVTMDVDTPEDLRAILETNEG